MFKESDSGWVEMASVASVKWKRIDTSGEDWEVEVDSVATGGNSILGIAIMHNAHEPVGDWTGTDRETIQIDYSNAADDVLGLLGWNL